ncbi:SHOCT domain-containing protein [Microcoleus sp. M2_C2]|uniref:SHOCT domain-containing protein n=1 Tax=Microcoleus sp. M2_C2 TaxID=3055369 RepID=UPI002FD4C6DF
MRELVILLFLFGIPAIIAYAIWRVYSLTISHKARLRRLEELRSSGAITAAEYEQQRASIISGV